MRFSYRLIQDKNGYVAECCESEVAGEGKTAKEAVGALRTSLEERMFRPDAVAPPRDATKDTIELVLADGERQARPDEKPTFDLGGPGDAPLPR